MIEQNVDILLFINEGNSISDEIIRKKKIDYISPEFNVGVSEGLNSIIKKILDSNYDFLFTFDQDSMITRNFVKDIAKFFVKARNIDQNIISCSPVVLDIKFKENSTEKFSNNKFPDFQYIDFAITSGSLFIKSSFEKIGLMNDYFYRWS